MWLIFGGSGFLGSVICRFLTERGIAYVAPTSTQCDLRDTEGVSRWVDKVAPEVIVNCVAMTNVDFCETHPELARELNTVAPARLATLSRGRKAFFLHFSTDYVFSGTKLSPYIESDLTDPINVYGWSKRMAEEAIQAAYQDKSLIIRTAWLFSEERRGFFVYLSELSAQSPGEVTFPRQVGSPTYLNDLAETTLKLVEDRRAGIFHVVNSGGTTWKEMAEFFFTCYPGGKFKVSEKTEDNRPARRPKYSVLATDKLKEKAGIVMRPWQEAAKECIERMNEKRGEL
ncbi:MAG: dTDP-4-dehydrorhamnose reductase [Deltaproteobacteria bacterium]|nr:MAG: dTDP-4-dehydrorhamnose reductase [Deltaproteobacteria bacterium]